MAQITVCDLCGTPLTRKDEESFVFRGQVIKAAFEIRYDDNGSERFAEAELCRYCQIDALKSLDDRPQPVWEGVKIHPHP